MHKNIYTWQELIHIWMLMSILEYFNDFFPMDHCSSKNTPTSSKNRKKSNPSRFEEDNFFCNIWEIYALQQN